MKNTGRLRFLPLNLTLLLIGLQGRCQDETTSFGFSYNFVENKPTIDLLFNRKAAQKAKEKFDFALVKNVFVLQPTSEIHLGAGTTTSENNMIGGLNTFFRGDIPSFKSDKWTWLYKINVLSPQFATDKDFTIYQSYLTLGGDLIPYYSRRSEAGYIEGGIGADFDYGWSNVEATGETEAVSRIKFRPFLQYQFLKKISDTKYSSTPENDPDFYYKMDITVRFIQYNFFKQDVRVINDKSIGYFNASLGYRMFKSLKLLLEYKEGRMEPKYNKVSSFSFGLALVR